jgi:AcrR family transcriptional regulator
MEAARACFVDQGFDGTSTDAVLARAGVSKGALYHHFANKAELLAAVFEWVTQETVKQAELAAVGARSPRDALGLVLKAWLRAVLQPEPRRLILETGPAVLGFARARQIEETTTQAPLRSAIEYAVKYGHARCADTDLVARVLSAAVSELALIAIQRKLHDQQVETLDQQVDALVDALVPRTQGVAPNAGIADRSPPA